MIDSGEGRAGNNQVELLRIMEQTTDVLQYSLHQTNRGLGVLHLFVLCFFNM
jgi:hypothetical protein